MIMTPEIKAYLLGLGGIILCVTVGYGLQKDMEQAAYKIGSLTEKARELNNKISELQAENSSLRYQSEKEVAEKYAKLDLSKLHVTCNQDVEYSGGVARLKDWSARSVEGLIIIPVSYDSTIKTCKQLFDKFGVTGTISEPTEQQILDTVPSNQAPYVGSTTLECTPKRCPGTQWLTGKPAEAGKDKR